MLGIDHLVFGVLFFVWLIVTWCFDVCLLWLLIVVLFCLGCWVIIDVFVWSFNSVVCRFLFFDLFVVFLLCVF